jgi:hypothetical protein
MAVHSVTTQAIDTSAAHVLELTATLANVGDTAAGELWLIEPFNLVKGID